MSVRAYEVKNLNDELRSMIHECSSRDQEEKIESSLKSVHAIVRNKKHKILS